MHSLPYINIVCKIKYCSETHSVVWLYEIAELSDMFSSLSCFLLYTNILVIEQLSRYVYGLATITLDFRLINWLACKLLVRLEVLYILWSDTNNSFLNYMWYMQSWKNWHIVLRTWITFPGPSQTLVAYIATCILLESSNTFVIM